MVVVETPAPVLRHLEPHDLDALFAPYRAPGVEHARQPLRRRRLICLFTRGNVASVRAALKAGMAFERGSTDAFGRCLIGSRPLVPQP